jgi:putative colanic acid biosysnthesis UDP-glucose lipid carrier transferase
MNHRFYKYFPWIFVLGDSLVILLSLIFSLFFTATIDQVPSDGFSNFTNFVMVWLVITVLRKDYKIGRTSRYEDTLKKLFESLIWFLAIIAVIWLPFESNSLRVFFFVCLGFTSYILLALYRVGIQLSLKKYRKKGFNFRNAVILGKGDSSEKLAKVLNKRKDYGINFLGYYDEATCVQTRGGLEKFFEEATQIGLDLIYINETLDAKLVKKIIEFADELYIKVKIIPGGSLQLEKNLSFSKYEDFFVINVNEIPLDSILNRFVKRAFDLVFSLLVTVFILSWLIPLVGLLIKWESKGPIFFIQDRNGENNVVFKCLKFRSMTPNDYADTQQATKNDPRVTRIGAFLRATSLDEMPQFLNVLTGSMSIVGPRPHTIPMNRIFKTQINKYNSRHKIRPGITGLAQVKGYRGEIQNPHQIRSRVKMDYFYIQNWSLWLDINICVRTVYELMFNKEKAY